MLFAAFDIHCTRLHSNELTSTISAMLQLRKESLHGNCGKIPLRIPMIRYHSSISLTLKFHPQFLKFITPLVLLSDCGGKGCSVVKWDCWLLGILGYQGHILSSISQPAKISKIVWGFRVELEVSEMEEHVKHNSEPFIFFPFQFFNQKVLRCQPCFASEQCQVLLFNP